ncbi:tRNA methyltransferase, has a role in tRNA modification [Ophidiomyces ophidiicola]|nr:tRNA methyltransferase, has a role in tRNA modification [Ophidiomyces ophidiicola]KAI2014085.1 tRNA methyltransferase, has a role in tRNA modification [Ophidiomyces ophidiicola]KAI2025738.1 tRNA methyltransferase, has a role in tRNA modification [Ophidiomyces ophidiicola]KAI2059694.1 tRNA methyltransferase, has a role in tRNA modification [Ophidiomyces ophidiicola]KAI2142395.1 tRNA methyltransferase, has a role in tRNA modification [Ophidiomyces ophidiicola]
MADVSDNAATYEEEHVHRVYQEIAHHFSSTRYKPWPIVERFLSELPPGSLGLDVGCGNGKYLPVNTDIFIIGSDRSEALVRIASEHAPHSAVVADSLNLPHPNGQFDFAISIAVVHHLSTRERRVKAIESILGTLKSPRSNQVGGKALIYVWALEQKNSRRGWNAGDEQDVMVPWVKKGKNSDNHQESTQTFLRYYHLYQSGELENDIHTAGGNVLDHGYEKDNWWAIATPLSQ